MTNLNGVVRILNGPLPPRLLSPSPVNFPSTSAITTFPSRCTWLRDFVRFVVGSHCRGDSLRFSWLGRTTPRSGSNLGRH
jgi:hypothetical protein